MSIKCDILVWRVSRLCINCLFERGLNNDICFEIFEISSKLDIRSGLSYEQIAFWEILNFKVVKRSLKATKTPEID